MATVYTPLAFLRNQKMRHAMFRAVSAYSILIMTPKLEVLSWK